MIANRLIRKTFSAPVKLDSYLLDVSSRIETHKYLGGATQDCYIRMVQLLVSMYLLQGRDLSTVRVLDWGAGKGHISYLLKLAGFDVVSCDVSSSEDDSLFGQDTPIIVEKSITVISLIDPWLLPFKDSEFDLVVGFGVLEHVPNDCEFLQKLRRIIKPGGIFFFSFLPFWLSWSLRLAHLRGNRYHPKLISTKILTLMALNAGFKVGSMWHGQLFQKNSLTHNKILERIDRFLTWSTPLKYFATNLEGILIAQ
ncbi:MAG: class I SAM-dependent methyltransferase [Sulfuriferula sp.]